MISSKEAKFSQILNLSHLGPQLLNESHCSNEQGFITAANSKLPGIVKKFFKNNPRVVRLKIPQKIAPFFFYEFELKRRDFNGRRFSFHCKKPLQQSHYVA